MNTYLSIDLDFWNTLDISSMESFLKKAIQTKIPITLVDNHDRLLKRINKVEPDLIINVDYHSDICNNYTKEEIAEISGEGFTFNKEKSVNGMFFPELSCGSWANYVKNRKQYHWIKPIGTNDEYAYCHYPVEDKYSPFKNPELAGYESTREYKVDEVPSWIFNDVVEIGIACSYVWLKSEVVSKLRIINGLFGGLPFFDEREHISLYDHLFVNGLKLSTRRELNLNMH